MKALKQPDRGKTVLILVILVLALSLTFNLTQFINKKNIKVSHLELKEKNVRTLQELENARYDINKYKGISNKLDKVIMDANQKIKKKGKQIWLLASENKIKEVENTKLLMEIDSIKEAYLRVIDSLLVERNSNQELNAKIDALEELVTDLNKRVGLAGRLSIENFTIMPQKTGLSGKKHTTALAKKTTDIKVCTDILANKAAKSGLTTIYVRIMTPNAEVLTDFNAGSGNFMHPEYKMEVPYTISEGVNYNNEETNVCITWSNTDTYIPGLYIAELFTENYKIGFTTFSLK